MSSAEDTRRPVESDSRNLQSWRVPHETPRTVASPTSPSRPSSRNRSSRSLLTDGNDVSPQPKAGSARAQKAHSVSPKAAKSTATLASTPPASRPHLDTAENDSSELLRRQLWRVLWRQFNHGIDQIYAQCEQESFIPQCREVIHTLQVAMVDFEKLIDRLTLQESVHRQLAAAGSTSNTPTHGSQIGDGLDSASKRGNASPTGYDSDSEQQPTPTTRQLPPALAWEVRKSSVAASPPESALLNSVVVAAVAAVAAAAAASSPSSHDATALADKSKLGSPRTPRTALSPSAKHSMSAPASTHARGARGAESKSPHTRPVVRTLLPKLYSPNSPAAQPQQPPTGVKEQSEAPPTEKLESFALDSPNAASSPEPSSGEEDNVEEVEAAATTAAALAAAAALKFNLNNRSWLDVVSKTVPLKSLLLQSTSSSNMSAVSLLRHPLHEKLSSPARLPARALSASRPSSAPVAAPHQAAAESDSNSTEALKRFEQASQRRQQIVDQRRQALREKNERVYVVAERMAASRDARRAQIVGAQTKAGKLHNRHIETIVQRAANQNEKVSEVAFITSIEADLARREMDQRQEASEARRRQVHQQRADQPKLQPAKRESAAAARRLELLAQRDQKAAQKRRKMEEVALRRQQLPSSVKAGENVETVAPAVATPAEPAPVELNPELINIPDPVEITVPAVVPPSPAKADSDSSPVKKSKKSAVSVIVKAPALSAKQRKRAEAAEEALLNAAMQAAAAAAAPVIRSEPEPKSRASSASKRQVVLPEESALATVDAMKKRNRRQQLQLRASTAANGGKPTTDNSRLVTASTLRTRMSSVVSRLRSCLGPSPTSAATGSSWAQELHTASPELSACAAQLEANLDAAVLSMQQQGSAEQATVELASAVSEDVVQLLKSDSFRVALPKRMLTVIVSTIRIASDADSSICSALAASVSARDWLVAWLSAAHRMRWSALMIDLMWLLTSIVQTTALTDADSVRTVLRSLLAPYISPSINLFGVARDQRIPLMHALDLLQALTVGTPTQSVSDTLLLEAASDVSLLLSIVANSTRSFEKSIADKAKSENQLDDAARICCAGLGALLNLATSSQLQIWCSSQEARAEVSDVLHFWIGLCSDGSDGEKLLSSSAPLRLALNRSLQLSARISIDNESMQQHFLIPRLSGSNRSLLSSMCALPLRLLCGDLNTRRRAALITALICATLKCDTEMLAISDTDAETRALLDKRPTLWSDAKLYFAA